MSKKQKDPEEKSKSEKLQKPFVANQGLPNTGTNAWPVKLTDDSSNVIGISRNPLSVSVQNQVVAVSSSQVQPKTGTPLNEIKPGDTVSVVFDTSNFQEVYVWIQLLTAGRVDVDIISQVTPIPNVALNIDNSEASFNLTTNKPTVRIVNASGTTTIALLTNPPTAKNPIQVVVALKGIG